MAISGSGTQYDPYLVGNYDELHTITRGHGTYWTLGDKVYVKLIADIWGNGVDWDLSTYCIRRYDSELGRLWYEMSPFVLDLNGFSFVNPKVTTGLLFPVPKIYKNYPEGGVYLNSMYYGNKGSNLIIVKNGSIVNLNLPDLSDKAIYAIWLINTQFINVRINNHPISDTRTHPQRAFAFGCFIDRCTVTGTMNCCNRGEIPNNMSLGGQYWFSRCTILHSDLMCNMMNVGEYKVSGTSYTPGTQLRDGTEPGYDGTLLIGTATWKTRIRGTITGNGYFGDIVGNITQYNVIDLDMTDCVKAVDKNMYVCSNRYTGNVYKNVCNMDNLPGMSTRCIGVTSEQITSGNALRQLGFPITNTD